MAGTQICRVIPAGQVEIPAPVAIAAKVAIVNNGHKVKEVKLPAIPLEDRDVIHVNIVSGTMYSARIQEGLDAACERRGWNDHRWVGGMYDTKLQKWVSVTANEFGHAEYNRWTMEYNKNRNCRRYGVCPAKYASGIKPKELPIAVSTFRPEIDKKTGKRIMVPMTFHLFNLCQTFGCIGTQPGQVPPIPK